MLHNNEKKLWKIYYIDLKGNLLKIQILLSKVAIQKKKVAFYFKSFPNYLQKTPFFSLCPLEGTDNI